jgi:hypothetical protein
VGKLSKSTASRICEKLRERYEAFRRRDLYDVGLVAFFLDATFLAVRPDGPRRASLSPGAHRDRRTRAAGGDVGEASPTRTGRRSDAT